MAQNLFADLAAGYANSRPPVHPRIIERAQRRIQKATFTNALDIGCGAGLSTLALAPLSTHAIGLEPAEAMLRQASKTNAYVVGCAEGLPFADQSIELMTAAGSLNYTDNLSGFFTEARRVLKHNGTMLVYDFSQGRNDTLKGWFDQFMTRYPKAQDNARFLDPATLHTAAAGSFGMPWHEHFQIPIPLDQDFYIDYMMTETNVADAIRRGNETAAQIRMWITQSLSPLFAGKSQQILFDGYVACLQ